MSEILTFKGTLFPKDKFIDDISSDLPKDWVDTESYAHKIIESTKEFGSREIIDHIGSVFFILWLIAGIVYTDESKIFLSILLSGIIIVVIPIMGAVIVTVRSKEFFISGLVNTAMNIMKSKAMKATVIVVSLLKISATIFILYNHFFANQYL